MCRTDDQLTTPGDRIVKRITELRGEDFDHGAPAEHLLRHRDHVLSSLPDETLKNFEALIERLNATAADS